MREKYFANKLHPTRLKRAFGMDGQLLDAATCLLGPDSPGGSCASFLCGQWRRGTPARAAQNPAACPDRLPSCPTGPCAGPCPPGSAAPPGSAPCSPHHDGSPPHWTTQTQTPCSALWFHKRLAGRYTRYDAHLSGIGATKASGFLRRSRISSCRLGPSKRLPEPQHHACYASNPIQPGPEGCMQALGMEGAW